jgi:OmpA-OmpF porin, OOP family
MKKIVVLSLAALLAGSAMAGDAYIGVDVANTKVSDLDLSGTGLGVYGGYRMNDSLGFELGYRRLFNETVREQGINVKLKATALQASALFFVPVGADTALFARLGVNRLEAKVSIQSFSEKESETKGLFGLGLDYSFSKSTAMRVEFQRPDSGTNVLSLGVKFSF